jgi:hypothetical protein
VDVTSTQKQELLQACFAFMALRGIRSRLIEAPGSGSGAVGLAVDRGYRADGREGRRNAY